MEQKQLNPIYKKTLIKIITKHVPQGTIYLFGSRAAQTAQKTSDIDIAIDAGKIIQTIALSNIKEEVEESTIPFFVDIVDFHAVDNDMQNQITKYGVIWKN